MCWAGCSLWRAIAWARLRGRCTGGNGQHCVVATTPTLIEVRGQRRLLCAILPCPHHTIVSPEGSGTDCHVQAMYGTARRVAAFTTEAGCVASGPSDTHTGRGGWG